MPPAAGLCPDPGIYRILGRAKTARREHTPRMQQSCKNKYQKVLAKSKNNVYLNRKQITSKQNTVK